jgi:proteic killer suppression protein
MILTFRSKEAAKLFRREPSRRLEQVARTAIRGLDQWHAAAALTDLVAIPGNRLESLSGDRLGQSSIRVNERWRVCFEWRDGDAHNIEIGYFGTTPAFWLNLQAHYDLEMAEQSTGPLIRQQVRPRAA